MLPGTVPHPPVAAERRAQDIRYWMSAPPITISMDAPVSEALAMMHEHAIRRMPVTDGDGCLCGMITVGDIRGADVLSTAGLDLREIAGALRRTMVCEVMTSDPIRVTPNTPLREAALLMLDNKIGGLPVVDDDRVVVGVVTESDLFEALVCYLDYAAGNE
jgi:CBS domain-containing protein